MNPNVSIVIATYNRAPLLARAVHSVLGQTWQDFEIIIVDDGSTDQTPTGIDALNDNRIRYIRHERNKGLPASRNSGIAAARGTYIAFLDDDDQWLPKKLARQLVAMEGGMVAVLTAAYMIASGTVKQFAKDIVTVDDLRRGNPFDPSSLLIRADLMKRLLFDESLRMGEDWDAFIRIARTGDIAYLRDPLILYNDLYAADRMTTEAIDMSVDDLQKRTRILDKHADFFGPFWVRYHTAAAILSYLGGRRDRLARLRYGVRRCGASVVALLLFDKIFDALKRALSRRSVHSSISEQVP